MTKSIIVTALSVALLFTVPAAHAFEVSNAPAPQSGAVTIASGDKVAGIAVDDRDYPVVKLAAQIFSDDVERVTGKRAPVSNRAGGATQMVIAGTLDRSELIDKLVAEGKLKGLDKIKGHWEATLWQVVDRPFPGVERAFVIVGSDRRGTAYGLMRLSEKIGVSPWHWWADVPTVHQAALSVNASTPENDEPAVKYRGIFINDEDWGLNQWARQTFEPELGSIGPKTYEKVFELMLRLRLNYIWPAMHPVTKEFHSIPENIELADKYGIVAGASHCEPMLYNNVHWNQKTRGDWNYLTNRDAIHSVWEDQAKTRGGKEAVWTLGIRGIHDAGMEGPKETDTRVQILTDVLKDQRGLLDKYVSPQWGPVAQAFVPYKEVLPLYDAGLKVPDDVTIVWADDNFGYIRRLGKPEERKRSGGAGVYWHLSYYGNPHSYTWLNTTAPALMWEELHKAWENDARTLWMVNVGDIKPAEIGIDYFSKLAWNPEAVGPDSQPQFLRAFATEQFGEKLAGPVADLLGEYYRLGTIRKPELMVRSWAVSLPSEQAAKLRHDYETLLENEAKIAAMVPADARDAYFETVGFPAQVLGATGIIFMADRASQLGETAAANDQEVVRQRAFLEKQVAQFNDGTAGGKWKHVMPGLETGKNLMAWNSQVRWPWGDKPIVAGGKPTDTSVRVWRDAASADHQLAAGAVHWTTVAGLGATGHAVALEPDSLTSSWKEDDKIAPTLAFDFETSGGEGQEALINFMPTFRMYPGVLLHVAVSIDDQAPILVEVPASSGKEDENGRTRREAIQNNVAVAHVPLPGLSAGKHVFKIRAVEPGAVIDAVSLPVKN